MLVSLFIKKRFQHRCFPMIVAKFLRTVPKVLKNPPGGCFWVSKNMIIKYVEIKITQLQWISLLKS